MVQRARGRRPVCQALTASTKRFFSERNRKQFVAIAVLAAIAGSAALRAPAPGCPTPRAILLAPSRAPTATRVGASVGAALGPPSQELQHGRGGFVQAVGKGKR